MLPLHGRTAGEDADARERAGHDGLTLESEGPGKGAVATLELPLS